MCLYVCMYVWVCLCICVCLCVHVCMHVRFNMFVTLPQRRLLPTAARRRMIPSPRCRSTPYVTRHTSRVTRHTSHCLYDACVLHAFDALRFSCGAQHTAPDVALSPRSSDRHATNPPCLLPQPFASAACARVLLLHARAGSGGCRLWLRAWVRRQLQLAHATAAHVISAGAVSRAFRPHCEDRRIQCCFLLQSCMIS